MPFSSGLARADRKLEALKLLFKSSISIFEYLYVYVSRRIAICCHFQIGLFVEYLIPTYLGSPFWLPASCSPFLKLKFEYAFTTTFTLYEFEEIRIIAWKLVNWPRKLVFTQNKTAVPVTVMACNGSRNIWHSIRKSVQVAALAPRISVIYLHIHDFSRLPPRFITPCTRDSRIDDEEKYRKFEPTPAKWKFIRKVLPITKVKICPTRARLRGGFSFFWPSAL